MKVTAINGSQRPNGNTSIILNEVLDILKQNHMETEVLTLNGHIHGCTGCGKCFSNETHCCVQQDEINNIFKKLAESDAILLGTPVYFADVTANMKAFLERIGMLASANKDVFRHKPGAAVAAVRRGGGLAAVDTLTHFLHINQMIIVGASYWNMVYGKDIGDVLKDQEGLDNMHSLGENLTWLLTKLNSCR